MIMRVYRVRGFWVAAAAGLAAAGFWWGNPLRLLHLSETPVDDWRLSKVPDSAVCVAYDLESDRWLTFELPPGQDVVRLITNANLRPEVLAATPPPPPGSPAPKPSWSYVIRYEILDAEGQTLLGRDYHLDTQVSEYRDEKTGRTFTSAFYLGTSLVPAGGKVLPLKLTDLSARAARLRLRLMAKDPVMADVIARVYLRQIVSIHKLRYLWQRITPDRKQMLARGNVYATELLSETEKSNLLKQQWAAQAPVGIEGHDYRRRELYILREIEGTEIRQTPPPAGRRLTPGLHTTVPLPDPGGRVRLLVQPLEGSSPPRVPDPAVQVRWYGRRPGQQSYQTAAWSAQGARFEAAFVGGLLDLTAPQDSVLRAFVSDAARPRGGPAGGAEASDRPAGVPPVDSPEALPGETEITPEPTFLRTYLTRDVQPVEFDLLHEGTAPATVAVDLRRLDLPTVSTAPARAAPAGAPPAAPPAPPPIPVTFELLDAAGKVLQKGELAADKPPSLYDQVYVETSPELLGARVGDRTTAYFSLPPDVSRIRLASAGAPVLVAAYDRPSSLVKRTSVPEDYRAYGENPNQQYAWFSFRAVDTDRLAQERRSPVLILPTRPPEENLDVLAGRYLWEEFRPEGSWQAREILVPRDPASPNRVESLPVVYRELAADEETTLTFQAPDARQEVPPTLLYAGDKPGPLSIRIVVDGELMQEVRAQAARGEFPLPPVKLGERRVRLTPSRPVRLFINYAGPGKGVSLTRRSAIRFSSALDFVCVKQAGADEVISARLFVPHDRTERTLVRVKIAPAAAPTAGPHAGLTITDHLYDLQPVEGMEIPVLGNLIETTDEGQPFFIPLGADVPAGPCRIRLSLESGVGGYLVLFRITPGGREEKRVFFIEKEAPGEQ